MESASPGAALDELRRAHILTYTRYPKLGPWYPPLFGALVGLWVCCLGLGRWWFLIGGTLIDVVVVAGVAAYTRRRGVMPRVQDAPVALRRAMGRFLLTLLALALVTTAAYRLLSWPVAAVLAFVALTALVADYERRFARIAAQVERDSGLFDVTR